MYPIWADENEEKKAAIGALTCRPIGPDGPGIPGGPSSPW